MEDVVSVRVPQDDEGERGPTRWSTSSSSSLRLYLAVFDGHGGPEAAEFARDHLYDEITKQKGFWTDDDDQVVRAIKDGFLSTHKLMWTAVDSWRKTASGLPSTAGTTASVVIIKGKKMYIAHVGDSSVVLARKLRNKEEWSAVAVTKDHKPDAPEELCRMHSVGGKVVSKAGIARVVWKRPRTTKGPVRRSTVVDEVPFLAIARSLGDLWSYDAERDAFVVSPEPDVSVTDMEDSEYPCIILASDGVWNMVKPDEAVRIVSTWRQNYKGMDDAPHAASVLVDLALERWQSRQIRADNTSAVIAFLNPADDINNLARSTCKDSVVKRLEWNPSSISPLFPLRQNFRSTLVDGTVSRSASRIGKVSKKYFSKEDRVGSKKWRKMKRKCLPGSHFRLPSIESLDKRRTKVVRWRHTLPSAEIKGLLETSCAVSDSEMPCASLCNGTTSKRESLADSPSKTEEGLLLSRSSEKPNNSNLSLVRFRASFDAACLKHEEHSESLNTVSSYVKEVSSPPHEPLVSAEVGKKIATDSCAGLDIVTHLLNLNSKLNTSPDLANSEVPSSSSLSLNRVASVYCKRRRGSESEAFPRKCLSLELSPTSCRSYPTRFHARMRIPVE